MERRDFYVAMGKIMRAFRLLKIPPLTQEQVAKAIGLPEGAPYISDIERGKAPIPKHRVHKYEKAVCPEIWPPGLLQAILLDFQVNRGETNPFRYLAKWADQLPNGEGLRDLFTGIKEIPLFRPRPRRRTDPEGAPGTTEVSLVKSDKISGNHRLDLLFLMRTWDGLQARLVALGQAIGLFPSPGYGLEPAPAV